VNYPCKSFFVIRKTQTHVVYASTIFPSCIAWFLRGEGGVGFRRVYRRYGQTIHCASHPVSVVESVRFVPVAMLVDGGTLQVSLACFTNQCLNQVHYVVLCIS
jgi:hypothetical protein